MSQHVYERRYTCRACMESDLKPVLDLGVQPLANGLLTPQQLHEVELKVPLQLVRCPRCGLGQLTHVVDPDVLYGPEYPYRSGMSQGWYHHCEALAAEAAYPDAFALDIGCLDGVMMRSMGSRGASVVGCDPSAQDDTDLLLLPYLFGSDTRIGQFDIITAQNVFGHVDDARGFLEGVAANLAPDGIAIIEAPWIVDMVKNGAWDTIYHEHLSYWGIKPMCQVAGRAGLTVSRIQHFPDLHGGTLRYYLTHKGTAVVQEINANMCRAWMAEDELDDAAWDAFQDRSYEAIQAWTRYFADTVHRKQVMGYGAAAKFNTLLNSLENRPTLLAIFDETESKIGKFTPGWHIPILRPTELALSACDEIVVGASNWKEEIEAKTRKLGFTGSVVAPW
jgi:SAM-dependent methyltransferase